MEPRFRGLMARTVLLVYTLFELLGSWLSSVSEEFGLLGCCADFGYDFVGPLGGPCSAVGAFGCAVWGSAEVSLFEAGVEGPGEAV